MKILIAVLMLACLCAAQELPSAPNPVIEIQPEAWRSGMVTDRASAGALYTANSWTPQPKAPEFWPLMGTWSAATIADSVSSSGWNGRCSEANPLFRGRNGQMSQGKYWAVNGSILVGWTVFGRWAEKQAAKADREERTILRVLLAMPAAAGTAAHTYAAVKNFQNCR